LPELKELSIEELGLLKTDFYVPRFCRFFVDLKAVKDKRELRRIRN
jgi:hypothetical protein